MPLCDKRWLHNVHMLPVCYRSFYIWPTVSCNELVHVFHYEVLFHLICFEQIAGTYNGLVVSFQTRM